MSYFGSHDLDGYSVGAWKQDQVLDRRDGMTSNLPPDWTAAAAEPRSHWDTCRTNCRWATDRTQDEPDERHDGIFCPEGHQQHECNCDELAYTIGGVDTFGIWS